MQWIYEHLVEILAFFLVGGTLFAFVVAEAFFGQMKDGDEDEDAENIDHT